MRYENRNAVVLGAGMTGLSLARYLVREGAAVRVADTRSDPPLAKDLLAALPGTRLATGPFDDATFEGVDMIAISPGVAKDQPPIAAAVARGVELVGDIELFARALPPGQKVLAITGTNGKTTGRRVFRMAPLHHHYELKGWKENQVVVRFWIITMLLVLFGLSTLKLR